MAWFCDNGFVLGAGQCFGSVNTAIAGIAIAALNAALRRGSNNGGAPTAVTSAARKDGSTIATGNGSTATGNHRA